MSRHKRFGILLALVILAAVAGILVWRRWPSERAGHRLVLYGNVDIRQVDLAFNGSERIATLLVQEGDPVEKGQLLATLTTHKLKAAVTHSRAQRDAQRQVAARSEAGSRPQEIRKAQAQWEAAKIDANNAVIDYHRLETLRQHDATTPQDVDNARTRAEAADANARAAKETFDLAVAGSRKEDIAAAQATLEAYEAQLVIAERDLADANLYAPTAGVIQNRILEPGDMASPQVPVYTLALTNPVWVRAYVPEPDLGKIHLGMAATVSTDSYPGKVYEGWVGFLSPTAEFTPKSVETTEVRTALVYQVRIYVKNPDNELRLGMPATVIIPLAAGGNRQLSEPSIMDLNVGTLVVEVKNVSKTFATGKSVIQALADVSFNVYAGQVTGLIGPDAAGKTTLMRLAVGLLTPGAGRIAVLGKDTATQSLEVQAAVGYMPQRFGLYEDLTAQENLDLYANLQGVPFQQRARRYEELLTMTGLAPFTKRLAGRLSGGMKQKLGLACTLVRAPRLLLLDEPTVGVDPVSRRELWSIVYRLVQEEGMTVLLSTAYLDEAEKCAAIVLLHEGKVLGQGTPGDFKQQVQGRTYFAQAAGMKKRLLQEKLSEVPEVLDAVIQGDNVRLVLQSNAAAAVANVSATVPRALLTPVPPRFEDGFIALLHTGKTSGGPPSGPAPSSIGGPRASYDPQKPVIEVHDLQRRFGAFYAVKGITFEVYSGEIFGLLGANGAGKSTTFRMLCGLLPASAGTLRVAGVDLRHAAATARLRIGYMSQKFSLYGDLSVAQNLRFFSSTYGLAGPRRSERLAWALEQFGLADLADATSRDLSLGYKQRLALACALMHRPDILFLDEPTSGVDPLARREFWRRINSLADQGVTIMVTTHFMEEAEYCDRLAIMASGRILTVGTPDEVRKSARSTAHPEPTMEDAFIHLIEADQAEAVAS